MDFRVGPVKTALCGGRGHTTAGRGLTGTGHGCVSKQTASPGSLEPGVGPPHKSDALRVRGGGSASGRFWGLCPERLAELPGAVCGGAELSAAFLTWCGRAAAEGQTGVGVLSQNLLLLGARGAHGRQGHLQRPPRPGTPRLRRRPRPRQIPCLRRPGAEARVTALSQARAAPGRLQAESAEPPDSSERPVPKESGKNASRVSRWRFCPPSVCARSARTPGPVLGSLMCTRTRRHAPRHTPVHPHSHIPEHMPVHLHTHLGTHLCTHTHAPRHTPVHPHTQTHTPRHMPMHP